MFGLHEPSGQVWFVVALGCVGTLLLCRFDFDLRGVVICN